MCSPKTLIPNMKYFICVFFILMSCNKQKENPLVVEMPNTAPPQSVLIPLSIGNSWTTKNDHLDSNGLIVESKIDTQTIQKDTVINNLIWYKSEGGGFSRNDTDGYYIFAPNITPMRLFQYPAEIGDSIHPVGSSQFCKLISKNDTIEVNGNKYITYKYKVYYAPPPNSYSNVEMYFYFKPNIGLIKLENIGYYVPSGKIFMWERTTLLSFTLK